MPFASPVIGGDFPSAMGVAPRPPRPVPPRPPKRSGKSMGKGKPSARSGSNPAINFQEMKIPKKNWTWVVCLDGHVFLEKKRSQVRRTEVIFGKSSDELFFDFRSHTCGYGFFGWLNCESPRIWIFAKNHQEMTIGTVSTHSSSFFSNLYVILLLKEFLYQLRLVVSPNVYRGFLYLPRAENRTIKDFSGPGFSSEKIRSSKTSKWQRHWHSSHAQALGIQIVWLYR